MARRGWVVLLAVVVVIAAVAVAAVQKAGGLTNAAVDAAGQVAKVAQPKNVGPIIPLRSEEPFTVLVMGTERNPKYPNGPNLTDTMIVLSYNPKTHTAGMLSVPRDIWVNIPGVGPQRINTALEFGGTKTAALTVERYIGVPIEYYALVSYPAFVNLVNDVGGILVNVPQNIDDTCFPNGSETACTVFQLSQGWHLLNGTTALKFIRERHAFATGDLQRDADQQQALLALKTALLKPSNLLQVPKLISALQSLVTTNIPYADLPQLAREVINLNTSSITHNVLDCCTANSNNSVYPYTTSGGADVLGRNPKAISAVVQQTFPTIMADMAKYSVQVENGTTTTQNPAAFFATTLQKMGTKTFTAVQAAHTDHQRNHVYINSAVLHLKSGQLIPTEAYMIGQMLGTTVQVASYPSSPAQIVVVLGKAFPSVASS